MQLRECLWPQPLHLHAKNANMEKSIYNKRTYYKMKDCEAGEESGIWVRSNPLSKPPVSIGVAEDTTTRNSVGQAISFISREQKGLPWLVSWSDASLAQLVRA